MTIKFIVGAVFAVSLVSSADAAMLAPPMTHGDNGIEKVYGGCGPYGHRGPYGGCRHGGQWGGYGWGRPCPPGFHLGRYGHRCWRN